MSLRDDDFMETAEQVGGGEGGDASPEAPVQSNEAASDPSLTGRDGDGVGEFQEVVDQTTGDLEQIDGSRSK